MILEHAEEFSWKCSETSGVRGEVVGLGLDWVVVVVRVASWNGDKMLIKGTGRGHGGVGFRHRSADTRWIFRIQGDGSKDRAGGVVGDLGTCGFAP